MPIVQRYGGLKVQTEALPGVRKTAAETPFSEGAGVAAAEAQRSEAMAAFGGRAAQIGIQEVRELRDRERRRADDIAMLNAENQLARWEHQRLYNPETGALAQQGQSAFGLPEQIGQEYEQLTGEIEKNLTNDDQRFAFQRIKTQRGLSLDATIQRHVFGEMQRYEGQELQALVENARESAVANGLDPRRVGQELDRGVTAIQKHAPRLGFGPEQIEKQVADFRSATHEGVIDRLLANDQHKAAQVYYEETKSQIAGVAVTRIEKALEAGATRGEAQNLTDQILADPTLDTLTKQQEKAKELAGDRPELRDALNQRLEHAAAIKEKTDRDRDEQTLIGAYTIVDRTHDVTSIPASVWSQLPGPARAGLRSYAEHLARGVPVQTDLPTYYALMQQAAEDPETFVKQNLLNYRAKLDEGEFKQFAQMQASLRSGDRKRADQDLGAFRTHDQILKDTLNQYGIDATPKDGTPEAAAVAQLRRMLDLRMQTFGAITGKKPTNDDIQQTLDDLLSTSVTVPGSWWNIFPGGKPFFDQQKRLMDLTIADVPAADRTLIENALRRRGRPVTDTTVLDLYLETKARGRR